MNILRNYKKILLRGNNFQNTGHINISKTDVCLFYTKEKHINLMLPTILDLLISKFLAASQSTLSEGTQNAQAYALLMVKVAIQNISFLSDDIDP